MNNRPLTRRTFIAGCAGAGATIACSGALASEAFAAGGEIGIKARPAWDTVNTICQGCPNACGYTAYTVDGELGKTIGNTGNPDAAGRLCVRGYGYTQSTDSTANVKNPLRRKAKGGFQTISWDDAIAEIGAAIRTIIDLDGPEALACIYNGSIPNARGFSNLLMNSIGCGNVFVDDLTYDTIKAGALIETIGVDTYYADTDNADMIVLIDSSLTDISTPNLVASLQRAREAGTSIVAIDPRLGTVGTFANDWYPVNPGTELALLLAVCNYLIGLGRYDESFVQANVSGFDVWAEAIAECTPAWAQEVTGVESWRIEELAVQLAENAPHVAIEYGNGHIAGASFTNSGNTARVVCLLNAMLGAWNKPGGALLPFDYDTAIHAAGAEAMPGAANQFPERITSDELFIKETGAGAAFVMNYTKFSHIKGLITVGADVAYDYSSLPGIEDIIDQMELVVCITQEMTRTAELADYVLPMSHYLYTSTLPQFGQSSTPAITVGSAVIEPASSNNSLPLGAIIDSLASACGSAILPTKLSEEIANGILATMNLTPESLAEIGTAELAGFGVQRMTDWNTKLGKIQCASMRLADAGSTLLPIWMEPYGSSNVSMVISEDMNLGQQDQVQMLLDEDAEEPVFHLITGEQSTIGMQGYNTAELMDIAEKYGLDRVWVNADVAEVLGIVDNQEVILHNGIGTGAVRAFVTNRIVPTALYLPMAFGRKANRQKVAKDVGVDPLIFSEGLIATAYGALCTQEASVSIRAEKEGA